MVKQKLVWIGIPWLATLFFAAECRISRMLCLLAGTILLLGALRLLKRLTTPQTLCIGLSVVAALGTVLLYSQAVVQPVLSHADTYGTFSGKVTSVTTYDNDRASYQIKGAFGDGIKGKLLVYTDDLGAQYGDVLEVAGGFSIPESSSLWNGEAYYRAKGIFLEAESDAYVTCTHTDGDRLVRSLRAYRQKISTRICVLAGTEAGGFVSAMLLGTKATVSDETGTLLKEHGIYHVASVSGMHLVLLLSVWMATTKRFRLDCRLIFLGAACWIALYAILVETPVSILRAGMMYLLVLSGPLFFRRASTCNSLCIAGVLLTVGNPYLIRDASFLLSMTGTFGIGVFAPWMTARISAKKPLSRLKKQFFSLCCVSVAVFSVTLLYFQEVSVSSPIANLFLLPICSLMLLLSLVIFLTGGIGIVAKPVCFLLKLLYDLLMFLGHGLQHLIPLTFPTGWSLLPLLTGILTAFVLVTFWTRHQQKAVALSLVLSLGILLIGQQVYTLGYRNRFTVAILGREKQAVLAISYHGKTDLIDLTGDRKNPNAVDAYLTGQGIRHLDTVVLTKRASQMRVSYPAVLDQVTAQEAIVPTACPVPSDATTLGAKLQPLDSFTIQEPMYTVTFQDGIVTLTYGTLHFCIGASMEEIPAGTWDAIICTSWKGDTEELPEQLYLKQDALMLYVTASGTWEMEA